MAKNEKGDRLGEALARLSPERVRPAATDAAWLVRMERRMNHHVAAVMAHDEERRAAGLPGRSQEELMQEASRRAQWDEPKPA